MPDLFTWPIRVYYEDTDAGGVVYYANYLRFLERARTEWFRALGFNQRELAAQIGCIFVVSSVTIDYRRPARLDDLLHVGVEIVKLGRSSVIFRQECRAAPPAEIAYADAQVCVVCVDAVSFKPRALPHSILAALNSIDPI